jgi:hypothetical protein
VREGSSNALSLERDLSFERRGVFRRAFFMTTLRTHACRPKVTRFWNNDMHKNKDLKRVA